MHSMTSSTIHVGDFVSITGGIYQGNRAVVLECTKKMVYIQLIPSLQRKRIMLYNVERDSSTTFLHNNNDITTTNNISTEEVRCNIIKDIQHMREAIDHLTILLHNVKF
jgi:ribosomal protein L24